MKKRTYFVTTEAENGYRLYSEVIAKQLQFIFKAKGLGFTLNEISSLMLMDGDCKQVESFGLQKLDIIRHKIADLQRLEVLLAK